MISRLDAIQDIRCGRGIQLSFTGIEVVNGRPSTYNVILRRMHLRSHLPMKVEAVIDCRSMRRSYHITLTAKQVMSFIKRHYPTQATTDRPTLRELPVIPLARVA